MKPAWDKLMKEYADHKTALVADVDCTAAGKDLCEEHGVQGFPTIKYGDPSAMEKYQGGRDFNALKKFADENLKPTCSPSNLDLCDADKKAEIEKVQAMSDDDLEKGIKEKEEAIAKLEADFKEAIDGLQKRYKKLSDDKDATIKAVKDSGLGLMKAVKVAKGKKDEL